MTPIVPLPLFPDNTLFPVNPASDVAKCCVCKRTKHVSLFHMRIAWGNDRWIVCKACASVGKHCSHCGKYQPFSAFSKSGGPNRGGVAAYCKPCMRLYKREQYRKHGKSERTRQRETTMKFKQYGLTPEQYQDMFEQQGGVCAACGQPEMTRHHAETVSSLAVDHDHATGKIRGLLCTRCNIAIGVLQDDLHRLEGLLAYMLQNSENLGT